MIKLYAILIINKRRTYDSIIDIALKAAVAARLYEMGYNTDGNPISTN